MLTWIYHTCVSFTAHISHSCRRRQLLFWLKLFCTQRLAILLPRDAMRLLFVCLSAHLSLYNVYLPLFTVINLKKLISLKLSVRTTYSDLRHLKLHC